MVVLSTLDENSFSNAVIITFTSRICVASNISSWPGFISSSWSNPQMWNPSYWHLTGRWSQLLYWILSSPFTTSSQLIAGVLALLLITVVKSSNFASEHLIQLVMVWSHISKVMGDILWLLVGKHYLSLMRWYTYLHSDGESQVPLCVHATALHSGWYTPNAPTGKHHKRKCLH